MNEVVPEQKRNVSSVGIFLLLLGIVLLLSRFHVFYFSWPKIIWLFIATFGLVHAVRAFGRHKRGGVFTGSLLFFIGIVFVLKHFNILPYEFHDVVPELSIALGLAFFMVFLSDPASVGLLVPTLIFSGAGVVYYLWWWDVLDLYDIRHYARIYWPALIIMIGVAMILSRKKR